MFRDNDFASVEREKIKKAIKKREIRLVVATDAACEGLNLQTLGTLINVDLPWNPSRLEQRLGRIKRIGQAAPDRGHAQSRLSRDPRRKSVPRHLASDEGSLPAGCRILLRTSGSRVRKNWRR
jgi:superfamily II DNA/RNA helicase